MLHLIYLVVFSYFLNAVLCCRWETIESCIYFCYNTCVWNSLLYMSKKSTYYSWTCVKAHVLMWFNKCETIAFTCDFTCRMPYNHNAYFRNLLYLMWLSTCEMLWWWWYILLAFIVRLNLLFNLNILESVCITQAPHFLIGRGWFVGWMDD